MAGLVFGGQVTPIKRSTLGPSDRREFFTNSKIAFMTEACSVAGCGHSTACSLGKLTYCRAHVIQAADQQLAAFSARIESGKYITAESAEATEEILVIIFRQLTLYAQSARDLSKTERSQLMGILMVATELRRSLQREPRRPALIPVRVIYTQRGKDCAEATHTLNISLHGALIECRHDVTADEILLIERIETAVRAHARVAWHGPERRGYKHAGVEILDHNNFWGLKDSSPAAIPATAIGSSDSDVTE